MKLEFHGVAWGQEAMERQSRVQSCSSTRGMSCDTLISPWGGLSLKILYCLSPNIQEGRI